MMLGAPEPFLRWAGGKRWLASDIVASIHEALTGKYIEPFLGSGAVFFAVSPRKAILSDLNADLINAYEEVIRDPKTLLASIRRLPVNEKTFLRIRKTVPISLAERAIRFIYLNRTCYGGIYRENRQGQFNTPYGGGSRTPAPLWEKNLISKASLALAKPGIKLAVCDFEQAINKATAGDVVFCDPTYHPVTKDQFNRYGSVIFNWADQIRLARACRKAMQRGALVLVSNTYCPEIKQLYPKTFRICLKKAKAIGRPANEPSSALEYLIVLDPFEQPEVWSHLGKIEQDRSSVRESAIIRTLEKLHRDASSSAATLEAR